LNEIKVPDVLNSLNVLNTKLTRKILELNGYDVQTKLQHIEKYRDVLTRWLNMINKAFKVSNPNQTEPTVQDLADQQQFYWHLLFKLVQKKDRTGRN
jgi:hypothetical protein